MVSGELDSVKSGRNRPAERSAVEAEREDLGRDVPGRQQRTFSGAAEGDGFVDRDAELDGRERAVEAERAETGEGVSADDRAENSC